MTNSQRSSFDLPLVVLLILGIMALVGMYMRRERPTPPPNTIYTPITPNKAKSLSLPVAFTDRELVHYMDSGAKVEAIKRLRELTKIGLKEAKDAVEAEMERRRQL